MIDNTGAAVAGQVGISAYTRTSIVGNTIRGMQLGVRLNGSGNIVDGNSIDGTGAGITLRCDPGGAATDILGVCMTASGNNNTVVGNMFSNLTASMGLYSGGHRSLNNRLAATVGVKFIPATPALVMWQSSDNNPLEVGDGGGAKFTVDTLGNFNAQGAGVIAGSAAVGGRLQVSGPPGGAGLTSATLYANPNAAGAGNYLLAAGVNSVSKFSVDNRGKIIADGSLQLNGSGHTRQRSV